MSRYPRFVQSWRSTERKARRHQRAGTTESGGQRAEQQLERVVRQLAAHAAGTGLLLHALQAVEHDQVGSAIAQAALEPFETAARRPVLLAEKELVALAQERVGLGPLVERPHEHVRLAGLHLADDALDDGGLAGAAGRDERPHAIGRRGVGDPVRQLLHQRVAAVEVRCGLERVDDANLAPRRCWRR